MHLNDNEKEILANRDFLISKIYIIKKVQTLFEDLRLNLKQTITHSQFKFDKQIDIEYGKIFKGEDYKDLPYVVLDYPKLFTRNNIFALRTMLWWGNFFSSTLHLEGECLAKYRTTILKNLSLFCDNNTYICINETPWEYHYSVDNYNILTEHNIHKIKDMDFLKISKKFSLDQYNQIPQLSSAFLEKCLDLLNDEKQRI